MAKLFDTHAHYTDERLRDTELLSQALAGDIAGLVTVASDLADSEACIALAAAHESVWASETGFPVIIHDREAHGDVFDVIRTYRGRVRGIIHSCSVSAEQVREYVKMGWYISFSGTITFKNAAGILDAVRAVPQDRILVETDCPYLAPVPMRGKLNHSGYLHYTAEKAAELLQMEYEAFCLTEVENAKKIFGLIS